MIKLYEIFNRQEKLEILAEALKNFINEINPKMNCYCEQYPGKLALIDTTKNIYIKTKKTELLALTYDLGELLIYWIWKNPALSKPYIPDPVAFKNLDNLTEYICWVFDFKIQGDCSSVRNWQEKMPIFLQRLTKESYDNFEIAKDAERYNL